MKYSKHVALAAALAVIGGGAVMMASAQSSAPMGSSAPGPHHGPRHFRGGPGGQLVGSLLRAIHQVEKTQANSPAATEITAAQPTIKGLLQAARQGHTPGQAGPGSQAAADIAAGSFTAAAQLEVTAAQTRIAAEGTLAQNIFNALGPDAQKAVLAQISADQAKAQARRAAWQAKHSQSSGG